MIAAQQAQAFGFMALCGAACAFLHDAARLAGFVLGGRAVFTACMDVLLGAALAVSMTWAGVYLGLDPMRLYLFAAMVLGALLWYITGGFITRRCCAQLLEYAGRREKRGNSAPKE